MPTGPIPHDDDAQQIHPFNQPAKHSDTIGVVCATALPHRRRGVGVRKDMTQAQSLLSNPAAPATERVKDAVSEVAGRTIVAGIGAMAYGAALVCWISEQIEARRTPA